MRSLISLFAASAIAASVVATSVVREDRSLEEIVRSADHIVVGKVTEVSMRDKNGKKLKDPEARTEPHSGNVITVRVAVTSESILKTSAKNFPVSVNFDLWPSLIMNLKSMKEMEGQSFIILLEGERFQPHGAAPFDFMWPLAWKERVVGAIAAEKNAPDQHLRAAEQSQSAASGGRAKVGGER